LSKILSQIHKGIRVQYPPFLSDFNQTLNFLTRLSKNPQIPNFMKIRPVGVELFHADERTDGETEMTKLIFAFHNPATAPKMKETLEQLMYVM